MFLVFTGVAEELVFMDTGHIMLASGQNEYSVVLVKGPSLTRETSVVITWFLLKGNCPASSIGRAGEFNLKVAGSYSIGLL
ncbi:hypothetical protein DSO57_1038656 [Entomophthora muscae]|uniref:Uncharacterized protein n=1 Tax=Entomophthora muscae TaxID=34485 RepID=A0ACC2RPJ7_9FUNG|nr:hypothetical protein DSO57_1038656 [Entomophthora muscae]